MISCSLSFSACNFSLSSSFLAFSCSWIRLRFTYIISAFILSWIFFCFSSFSLSSLFWVTFVSLWLNVWSSCALLTSWRADWWTLFWGRYAESMSTQTGSLHNTNLGVTDLPIISARKHVDWHLAAETEVASQKSYQLRQGQLGLGWNNFVKVFLIFQREIRLVW